MRRRNVFYFSLTVLLLSASCFAQHDWSAVENIRAYDEISVVTRHRFHCTFLGANDDRLTCRDHSFDQRSYSFARGDVREVRVEHPAANAAVGTAVGAAVGAAIGSSGGNGSLTRGGTIVTTATLCGIVGRFALETVPWVRGTVVFRR